MANITTQNQQTGLATLKGILNNDKMKQSFDDILKENAPAFMASIIELYQSDNSLKQCNPNDIVLEALKAATLKLPINKNLGFGYIVAYKGKPNFQIGYKGIVQLAQRTGQYRIINAGTIYEGQKVKNDVITGEITVTGEPTSEEAVGYFAFFELLNGFRKSAYWTKQKVIAHAQKYSAAYKFQKKDSPWFTAFDSMAEKTVLLSILKKYGPMSTELKQIINNDTDSRVETEFVDNANKEPISIPTDFTDEPTATPASDIPLPFDDIPANSDVPDDPGF